MTTVTVSPVAPRAPARPRPSGPSRVPPQFHTAEKLGAWQVAGDRERGTVRFRLFFPKGADPKIASIRVSGTFQRELGQRDWDFDAGPALSREGPRVEGTFWSVTLAQSLPAGFYEYKYLVTFDDGSSRKVSDPFTRYGGTEEENAAVVVGGSRPEENRIAPLKGGRKPLADLVIYELMIDDFTAEYRGKRAPLDAARAKLAHLVDLGFNAVQFMPWTAWRSRDFDWGYEPFQYFAVEYRYANDLDASAEKISWLKRLVSACHEVGLHVIMDGVFNHVSTAFPYRQMYLDPDQCPHTGAFGGTFPGLQDLDFNNVITGDFIRDVCLYWIDTFGIDGIRFDNSVNFTVAGRTAGLPQLLADIRSWLDEREESDFALILEHLALDAADVTNRTEASGFWDNALYERCFRALWEGRLDPAVLNALQDVRFVGEPKVPVVYLGNHDHEQLAWRAGALENLGAQRWYRTQPWVIALYTMPGAPMVQNGAELADDQRIPEDDHGSGRRIVPRPIRWRDRDDALGAPLMRLYRRMAEIRNAHPALRSRNFYPSPWAEWQTRFDPDGWGLDVEKGVAVYHRWGKDAAGNLERFVVVLNFSPVDQRISAPFPENGKWKDLLSGYAGTWAPDVQGWRLDLTVGGNWGHVFFR